MPGLNDIANGDESREFPLVNRGRWKIRCLKYIMDFYRTAAAIC
jgi:hypothetical protein